MLAKNFKNWDFSNKPLEQFLYRIKNGFKSIWDLILMETSQEQKWVWRENLKRNVPQHKFENALNIPQSIISNVKLLRWSAEISDKLLGS